MTQPDIDRLRELLANATPGDWLSTERGLLGNGVFAEGMDVKATGPLIACWSGGEIGADTAEANALLVASAKSALPTLLDTIEALIKERDALKEALTPSGGTKAAYIGEVKERICVFDEDGEEVMADHTISWDATKAIMKMIAARAAINGEPS